MLYPCLNLWLFIIFTTLSFRQVFIWTSLVTFSCNLMVQWQFDEDLIYNVFGLLLERHNLRLIALESKLCVSAHTLRHNSGLCAMLGAMPYWSKCLNSKDKFLVKKQTGVCRADIIMETVNTTPLLRFFSAIVGCHTICVTCRHTSRGSAANHCTWYEPSYTGTYGLLLVSQTLSKGERTTMVISHAQVLPEEISNVLRHCKHWFSWVVQPVAVGLVAGNTASWPRGELEG